MRWRLESSFDKLFLQCIIFIREGYFTGKIERRVKRLYNSISMDSDKQHHKQILETFPTGGRKASWPLTAWSRNRNYIEKPIQAVVFERAENWTQTSNSKIRELTRTQRESRKTARVKRLLSVCWKLRFNFPRSFIGVENILPRKNR